MLCVCCSRQGGPCVQAPRRTSSPCCEDVPLTQVRAGDAHGQSEEDRHAGRCHGSLGPTGSVESLSFGPQTMCLIEHSPPFHLHSLLSTSSLYSSSMDCRLECKHFEITYLCQEFTQGLETPVLNSCFDNL